jgi:hypothetical protein
MADGKEVVIQSDLADALMLRDFRDLLAFLREPR